MYSWWEYGSRESGIKIFIENFVVLPSRHSLGVLSRNLFKVEVNIVVLHCTLHKFETRAFHPSLCRHNPKFRPFSPVSFCFITLLPPQQCSLLLPPFYSEIPNRKWFSARVVFRSLSLCRCMYSSLVVCLLFYSSPAIFLSRLNGEKDCGLSSSSCEECDNGSEKERR